MNISQLNNSELCFLMEFRRDPAKVMTVLDVARDMPGATEESVRAEMARRLGRQ